MQFLEPGVSERIEFILKGIAIEAVIILGLACALNGYGNLGSFFCRAR
jgi:hypothetical protein